MAAFSLDRYAMGLPRWSGATWDNLNLNVEDHIMCRVQNTDPCSAARIKQTMAGLDNHLSHLHQVETWMPDQQRRDAQIQRCLDELTYILNNHGLQIELATHCQIPRIPPENDYWYNLYTWAMNISRGQPIRLHRPFGSSIYSITLVYGNMNAFAIDSNGGGPPNATDFNNNNIQQDNQPGSDMSDGQGTDSEGFGGPFNSNDFSYLQASHISNPEIRAVFFGV